MHIPFYFVDVFADQPLTGNPLAVVPHAERLEETTMQSIAAELNQAETTFILPQAVNPRTGVCVLSPLRDMKSSAQGTILWERGGGWRNQEN
jgi:PhzF family phenazine biosynthesis protein